MDGGILGNGFSTTHYMTFWSKKPEKPVFHKGNEGSGLHIKYTGMYTRYGTRIGMRKH